MKQSSYLTIGEAAERLSISKARTRMMFDRDALEKYRQRDNACIPADLVDVLLEAGRSDRSQDWQKMTSKDIADRFPVSLPLLREILVLPELLKWRDRDNSCVSPKLVDALCEIGGEHDLPNLRYLTYRGVAERLMVSVERVYQMIDRGELPKYRNRGEVCIPAEVVDALCQRRPIRGT